jgi:hypothetical protein
MKDASIETIVDGIWLTLEGEPALSGARSQASSRQADARHCRVRSRPRRIGPATELDARKSRTFHPGER